MLAEIRPTYHSSLTCRFVLNNTIEMKLYNMCMERRPFSDPPANESHLLSTLQSSPSSSLPSSLPSALPSSLPSSPQAPTWASSLSSSSPSQAPSPPPVPQAPQAPHAPIMYKCASPSSSSSSSQSPSPSPVMCESFQSDTRESIDLLEKPSCRPKSSSPHCPVCLKDLASLDNARLNQHIDECLNMRIILN